MALLARFIDSIEKNTTVTKGIFTLLSLILIRILFEMLLIDNSQTVSRDIFSHHVAFFLAVAATLSVILCLFTDSRILDTIKVVCVAFVIVPMVPVLDYFYTLFWDYQIKYVYFTETSHVLQNFLTLLYYHDGSPVGMKAEAAFILIACFAYVFVKTGSKVRSVAAALTAYSTIYWYFGSMILIVEDVQKKLGLRYDVSPLLYPSIFILTFVVMVVIGVYLHDEGMFSELLRDSRPERVLHYYIMFAYGIYFLRGKDAFSFSTVSEITVFVLLLAAMFFAAIFSIITNNLEDVEIDSVSNSDRPSVTNSIEPATYNIIAYLSLGISVYCFILMDRQVVLLMLCLIAFYYVYSVAPIRLKRVPVVSKFIIGYNSFVCMLIGYAYGGGNIKQFPALVATGMVVCISLSSNFIDLKDYYGDIAGRVRTLPNLLGLKKCKFLMALMFLISSIVIPLSLSRPEILPYSVLSSLLPIFFLLKKSYKEVYVFATFESGFLVLLVYLIWSA